MRDPGAPAEFPLPSQSGTFVLPDADLVSAGWTDPPPGDGFPSRPDKAKSVSGAMLALGVALLLLVPVSGVFFLVAGGLGFTIASGASAGGVPSPPSPPAHSPPTYE